MPQKKPHKKTDSELFSLITEKIFYGDYLFLTHAKKRLKDRDVNDIEVLNILENKLNRRRKRNKHKDTYIVGYHDWNYCIEGNDIDARKIKIIISFDNNLMLIITVIRIDGSE